MSKLIASTMWLICSFQCYFFLLFCVPFVVLLVISSIFAAPGVTPKTKDCKECGLDYAPVCGGPKGSQNDREKKSFGSICVMEKYNCEKGESMRIQIQNKSCDDIKYTLSLIFFVDRFGEIERWRMSR